MKYMICLVFSLLLSACSTSFSEIKQVDDKAYLQLSGNLQGTTLVLDNTTTVQLDGETVAKFDLSVGSHQVEISRGQQVLVKRKIYVTNGNVFEVRVP
jgi:ferric-dicitrate binding protein FerR (iron transport regulator)